MRRISLWLIPLSIALSLAVPLGYGGVAALNAMQELPAAALAALLLMVMMSWLCSAARLRLLASAFDVHLRARTTVSTTIACEFAMVTTPFGSGTLPMHVLLLSRRGLSAGRTAAIVAMDGAMDLVFFATAVPVAFVAYGLTSGHGDLSSLGSSAGILLLAGLCVLTLLVHHHRWLILRIGRLLKHVPWLHVRRRRLARMFIHFHSGLRQLLKMGVASLLGLYVLCGCQWLIRYSILPLLLWAMGHLVPWSYLFVVQGLSLFVGQVSALPGGGGGVELSMSMLLRSYLTPAATAAMLLDWRFVTFYWSLLVGAPVFFWLMRKRST